MTSRGIPAAVLLAVCVLAAGAAPVRESRAARAPEVRVAVNSAGHSSSVRSVLTATDTPLAQNQPQAPSVLPTIARPLLVRLPVDPPSSRRQPVRLTPEQLARFREAQNFRVNGLHERARDLLIVLDRELPHHPLVLTELAQTYLDLENWTAVEKLGRTERAATRDSMIVGRELATALERLERPRDAAQIVLEMWAASPLEADWASATVLRLAPTEPRGVREAMRKVAERFPERPDLHRGLARLEWQNGTLEGALRALAIADRTPRRPSWRAMFADDLLSTGGARDSTGALEALLALATDAQQVLPERVHGARRAWQLAVQGDTEAAVAPRLRQALTDIPPAQWDADLLVGLSRGLRKAGLTQEARTLLNARGDDPNLRHTVSLERALLDLREGPPSRALDALLAASATSLEAVYRFADALFFAGLPDSALAKYQQVAKLPQSPFAGSALERIYLIEDAEPKSALPAFGRLAYEDWRGNSAAATAIADSLYRGLARGALWAHAAIALSARHEAAGDAKAALLPVLTLADSLPGDRLAPLARQRAGDLYRLKLKDDTKALAQYEECLALYPRAWNAAEVRRRVEQLRRDRRF